MRTLVSCNYLSLFILMLYGLLCHIPSNCSQLWYTLMTPTISLAIHICFCHRGPLASRGNMDLSGPFLIIMESALQASKKNAAELETITVQV